MTSKTVTDDVTKSHKCKNEPLKLLRRIGSTTYEVTVNYSNAGKDTMADILRRVLEREVDNDG